MKEERWITVVECKKDDEFSREEVAELLEITVDRVQAWKVSSVEQVTGRIAWFLHAKIV